MQLQACNAMRYCVAPRTKKTLLASGITRDDLFLNSMPVAARDVKSIDRLIHDVNPSQLSGASHRSSEEKHYWMRGATR